MINVRHSSAIKHGQRQRLLTPPLPTLRQQSVIDDAALTAAQKAGVWRGMVKLLGKLDVAIPDPDEIEQQLREHYKRGYVQALNDVRREAWKNEIVSYHEALPSISFQEAKAISHVFDDNNPFR